MKTLNCNGIRPNICDLKTPFIRFTDFGISMNEGYLMDIIIYAEEGQLYIQDPDINRRPIDINNIQQEIDKTFLSLAAKYGTPVIDIDIDESEEEHQSI